MIVSTDSHVIEPPDLWSARLPRSLRDRGPLLVADDDADWWYIDGLKLMSVHGGADVGVRFDDQAKLRMSARMSEVRRGGYEPDHKLADMDADGVDREVVYTTLGLQLWRLPDTTILQSLFAAYNDWIAEFCAAAPDRLTGVALVLLDDVDAGIAELRRSARLGLRGAMISVYPDESIAYDHPRYEPFWAAAAELGVVLSLHIGTNRVLPPTSSSASNATSNMALKFLSTPARYSTSAHWVQLSLANMIFSGVFERHPALKVVSLEHEIAWVPHFLQSMDYTYTQRARRSQWYRFGGDALPSDFFHRNVMISFQEDALGLRLRDVVGVGNLVWGSDYPHAESTFPHSRTILDRLFAEIPAAERTQILDTNATALYFS